ncbi:MAG: Rieske 2Fe-2S domain-containing protein, partial [Cyanobacteria bacterium J06642_11]
MVASPSTAQQAVPNTDEPQLNWRTCWYPIAFAVDVPADKPYGFSIFAEPFVLFQDGEGQLVCLLDRCPHRLAKLSDGQVIETFQTTIDHLAIG